MILEIAFGVFIGLMLFQYRASIGELVAYAGAFGIAGGLFVLTIVVIIGLPVWVIATSEPGPRGQLGLAPTISIWWLVILGFGLLGTIRQKLEGKWPKLFAYRPEAHSALYFSAFIALVPAIALTATLMVVLNPIFKAFDNGSFMGEALGWAILGAGGVIWLSLTLFMASWWLKRRESRNSKKAQETASTISNQKTGS